MSLQEQAKSTIAQEQASQPEPEQISESDLAGQIREIQSVLLWLLEPLFEALETLTFVYPDLRAELTPVLTRFRERAESVIENWFPPPTPLEEQTDHHAHEEGSEEHEEG